MATRAELREWFAEGRAEGATHMIVACDTFDGEDFPVYVQPGEDARKKADEYDDAKKMLRLIEVYKLDGDFEKQAGEPHSRALNF